eukprot:4383919-Amphidinium_carterae.1
MELEAAGLYLACHIGHVLEEAHTLSHTKLATSLQLAAFSKFLLTCSPLNFHDLRQHTQSIYLVCKTSKRYAARTHACRGVNLAAVALLAATSLALSMGVTFLTAPTSMYRFRAVQAQHQPSQKRWLMIDDDADG